MVKAGPLGILTLASIVPWNRLYYPRAMVRLPADVRDKAIEIANALLREGMDEGKAIRIAIAKARAMDPFARNGRASGTR